MKTEGHLKVYDLTLTAHSPVFVGNGEKFTKYDYLLDRRANKMFIIDQKAFFAYLIENKLIDSYEGAVLNGKSLESILSQPISKLPFLRYGVTISMSLEQKNEIHAFVRRADQKAYIHGSSLKGALRTVLLYDWIRKDTSEKSGVPFVEERYLNTLRLKKDRDGNYNNPVNCILRGLSVADSAPIEDEQMMLAPKFDIALDGRENRLPLYRECIKLGTEVTFKVTFDRSILPDYITPDYLQSCISAFSEFYCNTFIQKFSDTPEQHADLRNCLFLGGGVGFFSKTLTYPYFGYQEAFEKTREMLGRKRAFQAHHHEMDRTASPRMLKYTYSDGSYYHYGVCGVKIQ